MKLLLMVAMLVVILFERSLDISAATGGLVYIGLYDVTDMFVLNVDDVSVTSSTMSNEETLYRILIIHLIRRQIY